MNYQPSDVSNPPRQREGAGGDSAGGRVMKLKKRARALPLAPGPRGDNRKFPWAGLFVREHIRVRHEFVYGQSNDD